MRISDWSSDVCSSDLVEGGVMLFLADRRADVNPFVPDIQVYPLHLIAVVADFDGVRPGALDCAHLGRKRMIAISGKAVNHSPYNEMTSQFLGQRSEERREGKE